MPHYYLHVRDGADVALDPEGRTYACLADAGQAALLAAREIISREALTGQLHLDYRIDIEDEGGQVVHSQPFEQALTISRA